MGCGTTTLKYVVFVTNALCAVLAVASIVAKSVALQEVDGSLNTSYVVFIVLDVVVLVTVLFGSCGALRENICFLWTYAVLLFLLMALDLSFVATLNNAAALDAAATAHLDDLWARQLNGTDTMTPYQTKLHCCGRNNATDYTAAHLQIPASCYADGDPTGGSPFADGCLAKFVELIRKVARPVTVMIWCSIAWEILCLASAVFLAISFRNERRRGNY